jgi:hypothetical protein
VVLPGQIPFPESKHITEGAELFDQVPGGQNARSCPLFRRGEEEERIWGGPGGPATCKAGSEAEWIVTKDAVERRRGKHKQSKSQRVLKQENMAGIFRTRGGSLHSVHMHMRYLVPTRLPMYRCKGLGGIPQWLFAVRYYYHC